MGETAGPGPSGTDCGTDSPHSSGKTPAASASLSWAPGEMQPLPETLYLPDATHFPFVSQVQTSPSLGVYKWCFLLDAGECPALWHGSWKES